jgi:hypothetical protein
MNGLLFKRTYLRIVLCQLVISFNIFYLKNIISYINVQKSTYFKSQEKRERKTGHACSWGGGGGRCRLAERKKQRKKEGKKERK